MNIKINKTEAEKILKEFAESGKEFFDISPLEIDNNKIKANDWYQELIIAIEKIFYESEEIISEMNKLLNKDYNPVISKSLRWHMEMFTVEKEREKLFFENKAKNIVNIIEKLLLDLKTEF